MEAHFQFEELIVYQKTLLFIDRVYEVTAKFPQVELYSLTSQFKRAANSIALNIGEGSGGTKKEFAHFLRIAFRSLRECVVCIQIAHMRKYIDTSIREELRNILAEISKMLSGLTKSLSV
ncbi:MAG: four helix bundle protein [Bacteroidota bacterium]